jgi:hypothetical protein
MTTSINQKLTTGRLYWSPPGQPGAWIDLGNCQDYKSAPKLKRVEHVARAMGRGQVDLSMIGSQQQLRTLTLDEDTADTDALLALAAPYVIVQQPAAGGQRSFVLSNYFIPGRVYDLLSQNLQNPIVSVYVQFSGNPADFCVFGADPTTYQLEPIAGMLTLYGPFTAIIPASAQTQHTGQVWPITQYEVLYAQPAVTTLDYAGFGALLSRGSFKFIETDQFETVPFAVETFNGQVQVTSWGDNKGDFTEYQIEVLATPC